MRLLPLALGIGEFCRFAGACLACVGFARVAFIAVVGFEQLLVRGPYSLRELPDEVGR